MRYGSLSEDRFLDLSIVDFDLKPFKEFEERICIIYDTKNQEKEKLRSLRFLDSCRHKDYPDDLAVSLYKKDMQPELVWVRADYFKDDEIRGELLNEPYNDLSVHKGESIRIYPIKKEDGTIMCCSLVGDNN